ncbi:MAG: N-acetyl-gamma-glutamyl-phosphate reductase, partial [Anaerolineae bacterium]|nr:N-acetyl-gamma-glutamyl-phosphate reductase [Anaerolineae bacterium]
LAEAVYGLTETARDSLPAARLVANPGCYPTSALLALYPLARADALAGPVFIDAKSGVSGAGRAPKQHTHFV